jgi:hypothetical protein
MSITEQKTKKNTFQQQKPEQIFSSKNKPLVEQKKHHDIRQDKDRPPRDRTGTSQPAPHNIMMRSHGLSTNPARSQNKNVPKRQTIHLTLWVDPIIKEELERRAKSNGVSISSIGGHLLQQALQTTIDMQYGSIFEPMIERAISKHLRRRDTRLISLLVRIAFDSGQTRAIVTNILGTQPGISPDLLREIIEESDRRAKLNIASKTPQITELIDTLEKLFLEQSRQEETLIHPLI